MNRVTTLQERSEIMRLAQAGINDKEIARHLSWSAATIRKWRRRGQKKGRVGLVSQMGRPVTGALSTYPEALREQLRQWRIAHPGWGAKTLQAELRANGGWSDQPLPGVASIARFLREAGLTRRYERHRDLPQNRVVEVQMAHEVWEMDAKGYQQVAGVGYISLINLNDRASHVRLMSYPCWVGTERWQRHPDTEDYQCSLRLAFSQWGLPQNLQVDHGSVFVDNKSPSPFPTRLHLWLLALGVQLQFGRIAQPRDQAMTERSHQLWDAQCLQGQRYLDWLHLYQTLQTRRTFLNTQLACRTLNNQPPLVADTTAHHSGRDYRPEWEADVLDLQPVWDYLQQGRWYRRVAHGGTVTLSQQVYHVKQSLARQDVEITFDAATQQLVFHDASGTLVVARPLLGISVDSLMGQFAHRFNLPAFQLALPFEHNPFAPSRLFETIQA